MIIDLKKIKNKAILFLDVLWMVLALINEAGILDIIPTENEKLEQWIKFIVAIALVVLNAREFNRTGNEDEDPPSRTGNEDEEPPKS